MPKAMGTAIVVGASSGIGKAIAEQLVAGGWKVGLTSRKLENLAETIARLGEGAAAKAIDLDDPEGARSGLAAFADELGGVDLWILNAGTGILNRDFAWEPERQTIATNVMGFAAMTDVAVHHCIARGEGRIVRISSVAKKRGTPSPPATADRRHSCRSISIGCAPVPAPQSAQGQRNGGRARLYRYAAATVR
ncbi:MAG: SDR family NAD(P)-dependent oxidoreductase [Sphingomonadales bacterium]|nr:SDR family NAD(P)-dependent oxidoreductase [Sphingomonadales bacterium]